MRKTRSPRIAPATHSEALSGLQPGARVGAPPAAFTAGADCAPTAPSGKSDAVRVPPVQQGAGRAGTIAKPLQGGGAEARDAAAPAPAARRSARGVAADPPTAHASPVGPHAAPAPSDAVERPADAQSSRSARGPLTPGLHMLATPIGTARDITLRSLDTLAAADVLAAEDTRSLRRLLEIHGIPLGGRPLLAYHDHSPPGVRDRLMEQLSAGGTVAYAPEAGTPMVSDPGYRLVSAAIEAGIPVHAAPGPSSVLAALVAAGLPTDRFCFMGFPPTARGARRSFLTEAAAIPATLVFFEAPRRLPATLADMAEILGPNRPAAVCRELTKRFEEIRRGPLASLAAGAPDAEQRGEVVLVIDRAKPAAASAETLETALRAALARSSLREAVATVTAETGLPRRQVYQAALALGGSGEDV